jgi:hypothetical protein
VFPVLLGLEFSTHIGNRHNEFWNELPLIGRCIERKICRLGAGRKILLAPSSKAQRRFSDSSAVPAVVEPLQKLGGRPTGIPPDAPKQKASQSISRVLDGLRASPQA